LEAALGYYIRVLGTDLSNAPLDTLRESATPAVIDVDQSVGDAWQQLLVKHVSGQEIAAVERNDVKEGDLGAEELKEFIEEVQSYKPEAAAAWLKEYLPTVKVIYAFQLLSGTEVNDGWAPLHRVYNAIWYVAGGILQADGEGFSNEDGYTILWQFGENASGTWNVGILADTSAWVHFEIELGNPTHRDAFLRGQVPNGVKLL
jgi:hypothetical protein